MIWRAGDRAWEFPRSPLIMGIVNVTPDSFSDGGQHATPAAAVAHALALAAEGADLLDIGGESTRPGAPAVSESEELARVIPVIEQLAGQTDAALSIDTQKPAVAKAALAAGAVIINDIAANRADPKMWKIAGAARAGYVAMHMQGTPQNMQDAPTYTDVTAEVRAFFDERLERFTEAGLDAEQVMFDPGIGFGKTVEHNLALLAGLERFTNMKRPLLVGASRKSFIGRLTEAAVEDRLAGSLACACRAAEAGAAVIRVHDVKETNQALQTWNAIR
ncbi:MAG: dihydropteroate synthase [Limisphaerales bacterium]